MSAAIFSVTSCICLLTELNSTSPILAVPATVRNPSGAKKTKSPATSCIVWLSKQPTFVVTGCTAIEALSFIFTNL